MLKNTIAAITAAVWIAASEFFRNSVLFHGLWEDHYKSLGLTFPNAPANGLVWGIWSLVYAALIVTLLQRFTLKQTIAIAWVMGFVLMWLVIGNLGVLPFGLLVYAVPLSLVEAFVAAWIAQKVLARN